VAAAHAAPFVVLVGQRQERRRIFVVERIGRRAQLVDHE
jgi:hypothetical protein